MVMGVLGAIVLVGNAGAVIGKFIRPVMNKSKEIDELQTRMDAVEEHQADDYKALKDIKAMLIDVDKMLLAILNHSIEGNGIDNMKKLRNQVIDNMTEMEK